MYAARQAAARALGRLARFSLLPVAMTCASGCFDPVPEYSEPTRVPPVIAADKCDPPTAVLYTPALGADSDFKVAFRADDIGLNLRARLYRDIQRGHKAFLAESPIPSDPRAFADQTLRTTTLRWQWTMDGPSALGCHVVTAIIADAINFNEAETIDPLEEARISWFVLIPGSPDPQPATCFSSENNGVPP